MIIGVPKEIKNNENRVAVTPAGITEFRKHGHTVYVQTDAGKAAVSPTANILRPAQSYSRALKRCTPLLK